MPGGVCSGKVPWSVQLEAGPGHTGQQGAPQKGAKEDLLDMMSGRIMEGRTVRDTGRRLPRGRLDAAESEREAG